MIEEISYAVEGSGRSNTIHGPWIGNKRLLCEDVQRSIAKANTIRLENFEFQSEHYSLSVLSLKSKPYSLSFLSLKAFVTTHTELKLMHAAPIIGFMSHPVNGYNTPAAIGILITL